MVSIILPVYNREKELPDCFRAILSQTYQDFEVLMVDDGSSDGSVERCRRMSAQDRRFTLITINHQGVSAARNIALDNAKGDMVFFIDSDDSIHPKLIETQVQALRKGDAEIIGTCSHYIKSQEWENLNEIISQMPEAAQKFLLDNTDALNAMFRTRSPINTIGGVMITRAAIGDTRFPTDISISEDFYFIYQIMLKGPSAVFMRQNWYFARTHETNTSNDRGFSGFYTRFYCRKLVWESEEQLGRPENAALKKRNAFFVYQKCLCRSKPGKDDIKKMQKVMRQNFKVLQAVQSFPGKLQLWLFVNFPSLCRLYRRIKPL